VSKGKGDEKGNEKKKKRKLEEGEPSDKGNGGGDE
jgi:hypothetical protein